MVYTESNRKDGTMDISTMDLADIGRLIAGRTANMQAAAIARSTAPQLRYDAVIMALVKDPNQRREFTGGELAAMVERIGDPDDHKWAGALLTTLIAGYQRTVRDG